MIFFLPFLTSGMRAGGGENKEQKLMTTGEEVKDEASTVQKRPREMSSPSLILHPHMHRTLILSYAVNEFDCHAHTVFGVLRIYPREVKLTECILSSFSVTPRATDMPSTSTPTPRSTTDSRG